MVHRLSRAPARESVRCWIAISGRRSMGSGGQGLDEVVFLLSRGGAAISSPHSLHRSRAILLGGRCCPDHTQEHAHETQTGSNQYPAPKIGESFFIDPAPAWSIGRGGARAGAPPPPCQTLSGTRVDVGPSGSRSKRRGGSARGATVTDS